MYCITCKYEDAIATLERSGKILYALNGKSLEYARSLTILANALSQSNQHNMALDYQEIVLTINQKLFHDDHEKCASSHHNISNTLLSLKRYDDARQHAERAIRINERVFGSTHVEVAQSLVSLGNILVEQRKLVEGLQIYQRSLAIFRSAGHPNLATVLCAVGNLFSQLGQHNFALEKLDECLAINMKSYGENHINTANASQNIGAALLKKGDFDGAAEHAQRALTTFDKVNIDLILILIWFVLTIFLKK